jgi:hypothetical protein
MYPNHGRIYGYLNQVVGAHAAKLGRPGIIVQKGRHMTNEHESDGKEGRSPRTRELDSRCQKPNFHRLFHKAEPHLNMY